MKKITATAIITLLALVSLMTSAPLEQKYDDDMNAHPNWDIVDIGTQNQGRARNNTNNTVYFDNVLEEVCPQVMGLGYLSDNRVVVLTQWDHEDDYRQMSDQMFSRLYVYSEDIYNNDIGNAMGRQISDLIFESSSMLIMNDTVWLAQKDQLVYFPWSLAQEKIDADDYLRQDDFTVVGPKIPKTMPGGYANGDYNFQEYPLGLLYRDGKFYIANSGTVHHGGMSPDIDIYNSGYTDKSGVGSVLSIDRFAEEMDVIATGMRANNALGWGLGHGPDGENWGLYSGIYTIDNQGSWKPGSPVIHVKRKEWHWYPRPTPDIWNVHEPADVAVWLPHGDIGRSPTDCRTFTTGIFAGQLLFGDVSQGGMKRVFLEEVQGQMQGSAHSFSGGFSAGPNRVIIEPEHDNAILVGHIGNGHTQNWGWHADFCGFQKMIPNGSEPIFEMLAVRSRAGGFEIEFTRPVTSGATNAGNYSVLRCEQHPMRDYGGGNKADCRNVQVSGVQQSGDNKSVFLQIDIPGQIYRNGSLQKNTFVQITLNDNGVQSNGSNPRTPRAWYTLNKVSDSDPFPSRGCKNDFYQEYDENAVDMDVLACQTPHVLGCMDPNYVEFNPDATKQEDGSCVTGIIRVDRNPGASANVGGLTISFYSDGPHSFIIHDLQGRGLLSRSGKGKAEYSLAGKLPAGVYYVSITTERGSFSRKVVLY